MFQYCGVIESSSHNDEDTLEVIRQIYLSEADNYVLDPHTAIGVRASYLTHQEYPLLNHDFLCNALNRSNYSSTADPRSFIDYLIRTGRIKFILQLL